MTIDFAPVHPLDAAARHVGGRDVLAQILTSAGFAVGVTALGNWKTRQVPEKAAVIIERSTGQQVTRRDLRPHDWGDIWPELIGVLHPWPPAAGMCKATSAVPLNPVNVDQGFVEIDLGTVPPCGANDALHTSAPEVA